MRKAAERIPLLWSPSMSLAVNLTMKLAEMAAEALKDLPIGRRRGNPRAASSLQGRLAQRHGPEVRPDHRRGDGPDAHHATAARAGPANGRTTKSAITPSASATIRASTRSSSACWAKRSNCASPPRTATATPRCAAGRRVPRGQASRAVRDERRAGTVAVSCQPLAIQPSNVARHDLA